MGYIKLKLSNSEEIREPYQCFAYKMNCVWPLEENSPKWHFALQIIGLILTWIAFIVTLTAEYTFVFKTAQDIPSLTEGLGTALEGTHIIIRIMIFAARQTKMRAMYRRFYREIHFTKDEDKKCLEGIEQNMRLPSFFSKVYYMASTCTAALFAIEALHFHIKANDKPYVFRMTFEWYDQQEPLAYVLTSLYTTWTLFGMICLMAADDFSISMILCHTSYRFKQIQEDLENLYGDSLAEVSLGEVNAEEVHNIFRQKLNALLKRQQHLIDFIDEANKYFTYTIFFSLTFATLCICVVMFQFNKTEAGPYWAKYTLWSGSKIAHVIIIGHFGQMLTNSSLELENSFYNCGWEKISEFGTDRGNKELMGDIRLGIMNAQKDVILVGLKLIPLTHGYVFTALRAAVSYFMFLKTMDSLTSTKS